MTASALPTVAFGKVAVLTGGSSAEREISLLSGQGVLAALQSAGVDAHAFDPSERPLSALATDGVRRCFIALHGRHGEDGTVQGALELLGIPYTGSGVLASAIAIDKVMAKRVWSTDGLPMPRQLLLSPASATPAEHAAAIAALGLPLIVKPPHEGSSIGVTKVTAAADLAAALALAGRYDATVLCEEFIDGEEVTCALIGSGDTARALPVIRIQAPDGAYDYQNKYFTDAVRYVSPSGLPEGEEREVQRIALAAYRSLGCRGWGRADLMLRAADRQPFLIEMNTSPGMTTHSLVPMAAQVVGIDYPQLCLDILAMAALDGDSADRAPAPPGLPGVAATGPQAVPPDSEHRP